LRLVRASKRRRGNDWRKLLAEGAVTQNVLELHRSEEEEFLEAIGNADWVEDDAGEWCSSAVSNQAGEPFPP
jgi:hypothetical protein